MLEIHHETALETLQVSATAVDFLLLSLLWKEKQQVFSF